MERFKKWIDTSLIAFFIALVIFGFNHLQAQIDSAKAEAKEELRLSKVENEKKLDAKTNKETQELQNQVIIDLLKELKEDVKNVKSDTKTIKKRSE